MRKGVEDTRLAWLPGCRHWRQHIHQGPRYRHLHMEILHSTIIHITGIMPTQEESDKGARGEGRTSSIPAGSLTHPQLGRVSTPPSLQPSAPSNTPEQPSAEPPVCTAPFHSE